MCCYFLQLFMSEVSKAHKKLGQHDDVLDHLAGGPIILLCSAFNSGLYSIYKVLIHSTLATKMIC